MSLSPQNQKESDLSHLGDLSDILRGHFDEDMGVLPYPGLGIKAVKDQCGIQNRHFGKKIVLKLTVYVRNVIFFFYKPKIR